MVKYKTIIKLDNNYFLQIVNNENELPENVIDIKKVKLLNVLKRKKFILKIDFNNIEKREYKRLLKKLLSIKNIIKRTKIEIETKNENENLLGYILNYNEENEQQNSFILAINAIFYDTRYERYNYIYDTVCNYLDNFFYGKNLCDFKNDKCGEKRNAKSLIGCCHHYKNRILGPFTKFVTCEYLNKKTYTCDAKCISCKLFTCDYLEKKGIKFKIKDILLLDVFFNPLQKYFIKFMVFTPKEKIIKRLMIL